MARENNRLLLLIEKTLRDTNRDTINPMFDDLKIDDLAPVLGLVARARAEYLKQLFDIAQQHPDALPNTEDIDKLKATRIRYEELVTASQALETAIERNYLDVNS
ncbi:MAG: hypothetical protein ACJA0N_001560 [Pseudohongiellaceae bacterium]|jgi:hypothetical protein